VRDDLVLAQRSRSFPDKLRIDFPGTIKLNTRTIAIRFILTYSSTYIIDFTGKDQLVFIDHAVKIRSDIELFVTKPVSSFYIMELLRRWQCTTGAVDVVFPHRFLVCKGIR